MGTKKLKILGIDDKIDNLIVLRALILESFPDVTFIEAESGKSGLELCKAERPDVVLLDIVMPVMDGYEVCRKIKEDERLKNTPVVMLTANSDKRVGRIRALEAGADGFLMKPVDDSELRAQINAMFRLKELEDLKTEQKRQLENMVLDRTEALEIELADRKKAENKLLQSLEKLQRNRTAILNLMEDLNQEMNVRMKAEKGLKEERNLLRALIDNLPDTIYVLDKEGKKVIANKADVRNIGLVSEADVIGKNDLDLFAGEIGKRGHIDNMSVIKSGVPIIDREEYFFDRNGKIMWLLTSKYPLYDSNNQITGLFGTGHDITNRKISQQELETKNKELSFLNKLAVELTQLKLSDNINQFLAKKIKEFSGALFAVSFDYIPERKAIQIRHIETEKEFINKISNSLGQKFFDTLIPLPDENLEFILREYFSVSDSLKEISFGQVPELTDKLIRKVTGASTFYVVANVIGGEFLGTTLLGFKEGAVAPSKEVLISFARLAATTIQSRRSEEKLMESEEKYRHLIENQGEGVGIVDMNEIFVFVNPAAEEMFGVEKGGLLNRSLLEFVEPSLKSVIKQETKKRSKGERSTYEIDIIRPKGGKRTILITATPQFSKEGKLTGTFGVFRDITERKAAEIESIKKQEFIEAILDNSPIGFAVNRLDDGNIVYVGSRFEEIYGVPRGSLKSVKDFFEKVYTDPEYREFMREKTLSDINSGDPARLKWEDIRIVTREGEEKFITAINIPLVEQNYMISTVQDVTIKRKLSEKIRESEAYYRTLIDISPDGIIISDLEGRVTYFSIKAYEIMGEYPGSNVMGKSFLNWVEPEYHHIISERIADIISGNLAPATREYRLIKGDKTSFWAELSSSPLSGKSGDPAGLMIVCRDISDRKKVENELIKARDKAEESDRLKTAFLHNISHEIRTPMNAITGFSALLSEPDVDPESQKSYIEVINNSSNHLLSIVSDIIEIANIEAGIFRLTNSDVNVNLALKNLYEQFRPRAVERSLSFIYKNDLPDENCNVVTDKTKLIQILTNLISNALKFTHRGQVSFGYEAKDGFLEFFVADTGIGISSDQFARIFDRFYQVESSIARQYEGTGLGLAISKAYVEHLGGKIWLTSEPGRGTVFYFTIAYSGSKPVKTEVKAGENKPSKDEKGKLTILIAEDEDNNFMVIRAQLASLGAKIIRAFNGREAVDICLSGQRIDIILMDIKMPVMDGHTATREIRKQLPEIPIIAVTAFAFESDREKALNAGCSDYIAKPLKKDLLLGMIKKYV